ncbi:MAG: ABC transporter ATP-binding protein [Clostridiaceae bacterium]|nr:ABC transporter ATP-binding protein [Clostridiaceae bacterium]
MSLICLKEITKVYGKNNNEVRALNGVTLHIESGEMTAIIGPSGSGKTTLLNIIGCVDQATTGEYWLNNVYVPDCGQKEKAKLRNERFGFIVQDFALVERYSVIKNVLLPLTYSSKKIPKSRAAELLDMLGLSDKHKTLASDLSGGQRQRVAIARALINDPDIILADEPTGALDVKTGNEVMEIFEQLNREGKTIIMITHNYEIANRCKRTIMIEDGRTEEKKSTKIACGVFRL